MRRSAKTDARHVEVRLRNLALERQGRAVLHDVSWTVKPGQRWVLAGGNGAGKVSPRQRNVRELLATADGDFVSAGVGQTAPAMIFSS